MGGGIHIGVHADGEAGFHAEARGHGVDQRQFGLGFAIEAVDAAARAHTLLPPAVLPTPEKTTLAGSPPAWSTRYNSPPETMSKPAPARASKASTASDELAFTA